MIRNIILWLLLFSASFLKAQEYSCPGDSLFSAKIISIIDKEGLSDSLTTAIYQWNANPCVIKRYAYMVDKLYELGLDLHSRLIENRANNSDILMYGPNEQPPPPKPVVKTYHKIDLFFTFITHKKAYEYRYYHKREDSLYLACVDDLVRYGSFTHPQQVRDVLLFKYRALTEEKFYQDMREQERQARKNRKKAER